FVAILITRNYRGIVRYTGVQDGVRIVYMLFLNLVFINVVNFLYYYNNLENIIPYSVVLISFLAAFLFLFNYRLLIKYVFSFYNRGSIRNSHVLIYGAGQTGIITKHVIESSRSSRVVGFLEDDKNKIGKVLNGSRI